MTTFVVPASDIDAAGIELDKALPVRWLESSLQVEGLQAPEEGRVVVRLSRSGRTSIVVRGTATAKVAMPCARCLDPATFDVTGELALLLAQRTPQKAGAGKAPQKGATPSRPGAARQAPRARPSESRGSKSAISTEEYEFSDEEAQEDEYDGETVVLDPFIREAILLELPNFPLCRDDCPGIRVGGAPQPAFTAPHPFEALRFFGREGEADASEATVQNGAAKNGKSRPTKMSASHRGLPKKPAKKAAKAAAKKQLAKKKPGSN